MQEMTAVRGEYALEQHERRGSADRVRPRRCHADFCRPRQPDARHCDVVRHDENLTPALLDKGQRQSFGQLAGPDVPRVMRCGLDGLHGAHSYRPAGIGGCVHGERSENWLEKAGMSRLFGNDSDRKSVEIVCTPDRLFHALDFYTRWPRGDDAP